MHMHIMYKKLLHCLFFSPRLETHTPTYVLTHNSDSDGDQVLTLGFCLSISVNAVCTILAPKPKLI